MIPNLPTDNLYKFMSLSGIVIIIFSIYFCEIKVREVSQNNIEFLKKQDNLNNKIARFNDKLGTISVLFETYQKDNIQKKDTSIFLSNLETRISSLSNLRDGINTDYISQKAYHQRLNLLQEESKIITYFSYLFIALGFVLTSTGFLLWYKKVQKPLDKILANDLAKSEFEKAKLDKEIAASKSE